MHGHPVEAGHVQLGALRLGTVPPVLVRHGLLLLGDVLAGGDLRLEGVLLVEVHALAAPLEPRGQVAAQLKKAGYSVML